MTQDLFFSHLIYWVLGIMFVVGFFGMMLHKNLIKKLMSMSILQTAVILFFLMLGYHPEGITPILQAGQTDPTTYVNPLPQALMLTAIVVNLSTTGVALTLMILLRRKWGTLDENEIIRRMGK
ncbi:cation:proton antiporter subunit C [Papillibacter cinnamivorans]|uniref:Multicomponent Na+:H+ antiporter subunit C n=1 Tax=Papillibacter cinnamivorans DSM 12816 TaxID=1122930 RepID=A0A1W2C556_9FIRM|nr:cation:proton antiporter subunit C [Papillibacter cinnamivorans]SMC80012.1 multicomponent Na+:H+ antiporter subunit C [Papillibacter cinnamivorans DSM 12816]